MSYIHKNKLWITLLFCFIVGYHFYFIYLLRERNIQYLLYFDLLVGVGAFLAIGFDVFRYYKNKQHIKELLQTDFVISHTMRVGDNIDVAEHDVRVLEKQLREQFDLNCDLQDYIAKWCHEVKLPLSACILMNESIKDAALRRLQKEQLEVIRQQLNGALLGCKVQSKLFDLQVRMVDLAECVKTAIHNNQFFLIQKQFAIDLQIEPVQVYTDPSWFVYVLDQLIQNAMKYAKEAPVLKIWSSNQGERVALLIEDHGEGILESDIRRIFERGYTGQGHHNGKYKSTGMGLYMAAQILERLGHEITVESEYGAYTRFRISLRNQGSVKV